MKWLTELFKKQPKPTAPVVEDVVGGLAPSTAPTLEQYYGEDDALGTARRLYVVRPFTKAIGVLDEQYARAQKIVADWPYEVRSRTAVYFKPHREMPSWKADSVYRQWSGSVLTSIFIGFTDEEVRQITRDYDIKLRETSLNV